MSDLGVFGGTVADEMGDDGRRLSTVRDEVAAAAMAAADVGSGDAAAWRPTAAAHAEWPMRRPPMMMAKAAAAGAEPAAAAAAPMVEPTVRTKFADTALWVGALDDRQGRHGRGLARHAREPDHLADQGLGAWARAPRSAKARPTSSPARTSSSACRPRGSSSQTDEVVLSANVHNYLKTKKSVKVVLELDGNADDC